MKTPMLLDPSLYWKQLNEYRTFFPDDQICIQFFEDFVADEATVVRAVSRVPQLDAVDLHQKVRKAPATRLWVSGSAGRLSMQFELSLATNDSSDSFRSRRRRYSLNNSPRPDRYMSVGARPRCRGLSHGSRPIVLSSWSMPDGVRTAGSCTDWRSRRHPRIRVAQPRGSSLAHIYRDARRTSLARGFTVAVRNSACAHDSPPSDTSTQAAPGWTSRALTARPRAVLGRRSAKRGAAAFSRPTSSPMSTPPPARHMR